MTCFPNMWLLQHFHKVKVVALTIFLYLVSPILLLLILLVLVYRAVVSISARISRKDLTRIIRPSTSVYASDELYGIPNRNLVCTLVVKGKLSLESLQNAIDRKIVSIKNANGSFKYPELRMYPAKFHKFLFWKAEEEFKVDAHVIMYDKARDNNRIWTEQDLHEIQKNLIRKQWTRFASPWEILLLPNFRTQSSGAREVKTVLCVRFHMCIANEVPLMNLLVKVLCDGAAAPEVGVFGELNVCPSSNTSPKKLSSESTAAATNNNAPTIVKVIGKNLSRSGDVQKSGLASPSIKLFLQSGSLKLLFILKRVFQRLMIPLRIPFDFAEQLIECISSNRNNEWEVEETSLLKRDHVVMLDRFSAQHVKEIKNMLGVTFSSVLMAALSSALRVTFLEAGFKLPCHMKVMFPLHHQTDEDDDAMLNPAKCETFGPPSWINLPMGISSSRERLRCCETAQRKLQNSTRLVTNKLLLSLVGLLPFKYHWHFLRRRPWTGVMMNLKGPNETLMLCDHQIEDVIVSSASDSGFVLSFVSYADYLRISLVIDYRLVPNEVIAKNLLKNIYAELVLLGIDGAATV